MDFNQFQAARAQAYLSFLRDRPPLPKTILGAANGGIPVTFNIPPESQYFEQKVATSAGILNLMHSGASLIGVLNETVQSSIIRIYDLPGVIKYFPNELETGNPVVTLRNGFNKLFTAVDYSLGNFAINGAPELQIYGLKTHPNASEYVIPANGTGASADWSDKTPALIFQDVIKFLNFAEGLARPNPISHLYFGDDVASYIQGLIYNADGSLFTSQVINSNIQTRLNPPIIATVPGLTGMLAVASNAVRFELVREFAPIEHEMDGVQFVLAAGVRTAGVLIDSVGALSYADVTI